MNERLELLIEESVASQQIAEIMEVIFNMADFDFTKRVEIKGESKQLDGLAAGINMLNEELNSKTHLHAAHNEVLKEVHHRMKNNLQIVSSIINLQKSTTNDELVKNKFRNCQQRIEAIALVHEHLYGSENTNELEMNHYFSSLCLKTITHFTDTTTELVFEGLTHSQFIDIDTIVPLGLIVSELIMNSFEHGCSSLNNGKIRIQLSKENNHLVMYCSDNGIGFNNPSLFLNSENLGLQLVHSLASQIDASVTLQTAVPCKVKIELN